MRPLLVLPFLVCAVLATADSDMDVDLILKQHHQVLQTILSTLQMRSTQRAASNFDLSNKALHDCFDYIEKKQAQDRNAYRDGLKTCSKAASDSKEVLSRQSNNKRNGLLKRGNEACGRLRDCERVTDGLQFFACYSQAADSSLLDLRNVSLVSDGEFAYARVLYQQIVSEHEECGRVAKRSYVIASEKTNKEMQSCIEGTFVPPSGIDFNSSTVSTTVSTTPSNHGSGSYPEEDIDDTDFEITHANRWELVEGKQN